MIQGDGERKDEPRATWRRFAGHAKPGLWMILGAVLVWTGSASSQVGEACGEVLPAPLVAFCPRTPARSSDMNHNFRTVAGWIENKVGPLSSSDVTVGNITATGTVTVPAGSLTGSAIRDGSVTTADVADGTLTVADLNPGVVGTGLQVSGASLRVDPTWLRDQIRGQIQVSAEFTASVRCEGCGTERDSGISTTNSVCFMVRSVIGDDNDEDDTSDCQVYQAGGTWRVRAWTNSDEAGPLTCTMRCLQW